MIGISTFGLTILILAVVTDGILNIVFYLGSLLKGKASQTGNDSISVLVATRDEDSNIASCLDSLLTQEYPPGKMEILVGDDNSSDLTLDILEERIRSQNNLDLYPIRKTIGNARGKGNVIAQLTKKATTDVFCITDADMTHSPLWASSVSSKLTREDGICIGATAVSGGRLAARLQNLDWLLAQGMIKVATHLSFPVTALGNNMAITREAYEATGGLENLPRTLTEDFQMFRYIQKQGYRLVIDMTAEALCFTQPATGVNAWLHQRKRWTFGAIRIHWFPLILLITNTLVFPAALVAYFYYPLSAISLIATHYVLQGLFLFQIFNRLRLRLGWLDYLTFQTISLLGGFLLATYCLIPGPVYWKGRKYSFWRV